MCTSEESSEPGRRPHTAGSPAGWARQPAPPVPRRAWGRNLLPPFPTRHPAGKKPAAHQTGLGLKYWGWKLGFCSRLRLRAGRGGENHAGFVGTPATISTQEIQLPREIQKYFFIIPSPPVPPVIHAGFVNGLGIVFSSDSAFVCIGWHWRVIASELSWSHNITVFKANPGLCIGKGGGFQSWLYISFLSITVAAKYTLCHNNKETLNSYNYVVTLYVNTLNHTTSSQRAKWEPNANKEEDGLLVRAVRDPGSNTCWRLQIKTELCISSIESVAISTYAYQLCSRVVCAWKAHFQPAKCPGWGRWEQSESVFRGAGNPKPFFCL